MTPLADVAFLLLTFFTCAMASLRPHVIEIAVPPGFVTWIYGARSIAIYVRRDGALWYRTSTTPRMTALKIADIPMLDSALRHDVQHVLVIKADPAVKYGTVVDVLDSISRIRHAMADGFMAGERIWWEGFEIDEMTDDELRVLRSL